MIIIPALDIINGKCVRLTNGDYAQMKVYNENPVDVAKEFASHGLKRLHLVDLDGAKAGKLVNLRILESIAGATGLEIDFGGGVKSAEDVETVFNAGASIVTVGSMAAKHPELLEEWLIEFGHARFLVGADVLDKKIRISGWTEDGGIGIFEFIGRMLGIGVSQLFCTDIACDGVLSGPSVKLYEEILQEHPETKLIASGGVGSMSDLDKLQLTGCTGAIIGKAIYEGRISLKELEKFSNN